MLYICPHMTTVEQGFFRRGRRSRLRVSTRLTMQCAANKNRVCCGQNFQVRLHILRKTAASVAVGRRNKTLQRRLRL